MVTSEQVKLLREKSGCGMMDCKKALELLDGNIEHANKYLRLKGQAVVRRRKDGQRWQQEDYIEAAKKVIRKE